MGQGPQLHFKALPLDGAYVVSGLQHVDERGFFTRIWSAAEFASRGLAANLAECSLSLTPKRGTLRGLHFQMPPHEEAKLVTCVGGTVWDVIVDLRERSSTFGGWHGMELDAKDPVAIYVPEGFAHGFLTISDDVLVLYQISSPHHPESATGIRWDDPAIRIEWPRQPELVGSRDRTFPDFRRRPP